MRLLGASGDLLFASEGPLNGIKACVENCRNAAVVKLGGVKLKTLFGFMILMLDKSFAVEFK
jgi:hypothetical protein